MAKRAAKEINHLADLVPDPQNARLHNPRNIGTISDGLREVGAARSIVIDENGVVLAGNGVVESAAEAGIHKVQVVDADGETIIAVRRSGLTSKQKKRLALIDNRANEMSSWDASVLAQMAEDGVILDDLWSTDELAALLGDALQPEAGSGGDEFDTTPDEEQTRVQYGDLWRCGRHRIACSNSLDEECVKALIGADKPAMVWSDPPYGVDVVKKNMVGADFGVAKKGKYAPVAGDSSIEAARISFGLCKQWDAVQIWWGANNYANHLPPSSCWVIWDKRCDSGIENTFADCEMAWLNLSSQSRIYRQLWNGMIREGEHGKRVHPTQKPVALAEWCFTKYGKEGDTIFDPFLGSGISLIAAERLSRTLVGCELSPDYINVCLSRFEAETGQTAELLERAS